MICALVLIVSLAACGAKDNAEETTAPTEAAETSSATETSAPAATDAAVIETEAEVSAETGLVGSWDYAELSGMVYTFNADGSGSYDMFGEVMKFTYEADGSTLKITYIDEGVDAATELEYAIDGDTLNVKDSLGNDTIYKRK
ncbi:MAG: hypothetical protein IJH40_11730 [Ruminococcus sp.]|uniref:DUF5640 domain-containing protein n=1 Tax=Ruminococcus sp. TaxID=41978 RepID=UPI002873097B|nr:DUF5640 domain-containing protein [Ruminococcus sp.]MBQ3286289.1 hypothetical protein [Ruminococcus sp.]